MGKPNWRDPHPPSRHCMCPDCIPSFDDRFAELAQVKKERDEAREACVNSANAWLAAANHAEKVEQENARLREALAPAFKAIDAIGKDQNDMQIRRDAEVNSFYAVQRARTALGGE